ncbi:phosphotransferase family protein [Streptomyces sp. WMMC500]|uniref:phosphotransferase family protein n=1 Tax=Streptomyces sp. WMMC500 TaxID=3015154 RepID=UPI00248BBD49|nr:phosphotransferase family protein [Streptomyces sp. WMMC500]WBB61253.1 phosphotransferase family protein [Streptomyces sp. WMMC500]
MDTGPDALRRWLDTHAGGGVGELSVEPIAGGRSNPTYRLTDGRRRWVLRRPPFGHILPSAHDMGREHRVLTALAATGVPVPRTVGLCRDESVIGAPFYVMDMIDGVALRTRQDTARLTAGQRAGLADGMVGTLARLHEVDPAAVGLAGWGRPAGYLERQLRRWSAQWEASVTRPRPQVAELLRRLGATAPGCRHPGIVHGDFKIDNLLVDRDDPTRILGVLDWELSTLGDTLTDLGILCSFWDQEGEFHNPITAGATALPGFPTRQEVVQAYAAARDVEIEGLDWYVVFADFKIAVILEGIHARHLPGHTDDARFEGLDATVDVLLDRALERASCSVVAGLRG